MHIVIAGAGRVGSQLAASLAADDHDVVVVDNDSEVLDSLGKAFNGIAILGEAFDVDVLSRAQMERADVFAAMTDDDNTNLMAAEVAKAVFGVARVIARLHDPAREDSYRALDIPYISTTSLISSVALEHIVGEEFAIHVTFSGGDIEIVEFTIADDVGEISVDDIEQPDELRVAAIRRGGVTHVPRPDTILEAGDLVVAAAHHGVKTKIAHLLRKA